MSSRGRWPPVLRAGGLGSTHWAEGEEFTVAYWTRNDMVIHVAGDAELIEQVIARLP
jgi:hypothetical protein